MTGAETACIIWVIDSRVHIATFFFLFLVAASGTGSNFLASGIAVSSLYYETKVVAIVRRYVVFDPPLYARDGMLLSDNCAGVPLVVGQISCSVKLCHPYMQRGRGSLKIGKI